MRYFNIPKLQCRLHLEGLETKLSNVRVSVIKSHDGNCKISTIIPT